MKGSWSVLNLFTMSCPSLKMKARSLRKQERQRTWILCVVHCPWKGSHPPDGEDTDIVPPSSITRGFWRFLVPPKSKLQSVRQWGIVLLNHPTAVCPFHRGNASKSRNYLLLWTYLLSAPINVSPCHLVIEEEFNKMSRKSKCLRSFEDSQSKGNWGNFGGVVDSHIVSYLSISSLVHWLIISRDA